MTIVICIMTLKLFRESEGQEKWLVNGEKTAKNFKLTKVRIQIKVAYSTQITVFRILLILSNPLLNKINEIKLKSNTEIVSNFHYSTSENFSLASIGYSLLIVLKLSLKPSITIRGFYRLECKPCGMQVIRSPRLRLSKGGILMTLTCSRYFALR